MRAKNVGEYIVMSLVNPLERAVAIMTFGYAGRQYVEAEILELIGLRPEELEHIRGRVGRYMSWASKFARIPHDGWATQLAADLASAKAVLARKRMQELEQQIESRDQALYQALFAQWGLELEKSGETVELKILASRLLDLDNQDWEVIRYLMGQAKYLPSRDLDW